MKKASRFHLTWLLLLPVLAVVIAFNQCSTPAEFSLNGSLRAANDKKIMENLLKGGAWKVWLSALDLELNSNLTNLNSLAPAVVAVAADPATNAPQLAAGLGFDKNVFNFAPNKGLISSPIEAALVGNEYTLVALLDAGSVGQAISLNNGFLRSHELAVNFPSAGTMQVIHASNATDQTIHTFELEKTTGALVLGISFGKGKEDVEVQIDGKLVEGTVTTQGTPGDSLFLLRQLMLGTASSSNFKAAEILVFSGTMTPATLNTVVRFVAERWDLKGIEYIPQPIQPPKPPPPPDPLWTEMNRIMQTRCGECHYLGTKYPFVGLNAQELASTKWVVKGQPLNSPLYKRLAGIVAGGDMPDGRTEVTAAEGAAIKAWIESL